jgi:hypothetical protein
MVAGIVPNKLCLAKHNVLYVTLTFEHFGQAAGIHSPIGTGRLLSYGSAPNDQRSSRTYSWKLQPGKGHTTLGDTSPFCAMVWPHSVNPWPCGQVIDALKRRMVNGWHGAQCIGGGSDVTFWKYITVTHRAAR